MEHFLDATASSMPPCLKFTPEVHMSTKKEKQARAAALQKKVACARVIGY